MSFPSLSAIVGPGTRFRATYRIQSSGAAGALAGIFGGSTASLLSDAVDQINGLWQNASGVVLTAPATSPAEGGGLVGTDYFTSLDVLTAQNLPAGTTWDQLLAPFREPSIGLFAGFGAPWSLDSVDVLTPGSAASSPTTRSSTSSAAAGASKAATPNLSALVSSFGSRVLLIVVIIGVIFLVWRYGPSRAAVTA